MNHRSVLKRTWMLPVLVAVLIASHAVALYRFYSRMTLAVLATFLAVMLLKHIGLFGAIYARFHRRS